jgi:hypothetical protein
MNKMCMVVFTVLLFPSPFDSKSLFSFSSSSALYRICLVTTVEPPLQKAPEIIVVSMILLSSLVTLSKVVPAALIFALGLINATANANDDWFVSAVIVIFGSVVWSLYYFICSRHR